MAKEKVKVVVDAEVAEGTAELQKPEVRTEFAIGVDEAGNVYYRIAGTDQSLITLEGLLKYAEKIMNGLWNHSFERQVAASEAPQE